MHCSMRRPPRRLEASRVPLIGNNNLTGFVARRAYSPSDVGFRRQAAFFFRFNTVTAFGEDDTAAVRWAGPTEPATFSDRCVRERGSADKFHLHVSPKLNAGGRTGTHARARARRRSRAGLSRRSLRGWNTRKLRLRPRYDRTGRAGGERSRASRSLRVLPGACLAV